MARKTAPPRPPTRRGRETRSAIVAAAATVLRREGHAGFSIPKVADEAGIAIGNLTYHFPGKRDLVAALGDHLVAGYAREFDALCDRLLSTAASRLDDTVEFLFLDAVSHATVTMFPELWAMATRSPELAPIVDRIYADAVDALLTRVGLEPRSRRCRRLREAVHLLGVMVEGFTAYFGRRGSRDTDFQTTRRLAESVINPLLNEALAEARRSAGKPASVSRARRSRPSRTGRRSSRSR
jgi:AcrR family transcriptional regulator